MKKIRKIRKLSRQAKKVYLLKSLAITMLLFITACTDNIKKIDVQGTFIDIKQEVLSKFEGNSEELPRQEKIPVQFSKHVDGDTTQFLLSGKQITVRYLLIDTPETVKPNTETQFLGKEASDRTKGLLEQAGTIEIMLDNGDSKDHYDRVLAYVFVDGELVQDILVREGLARIAYVSEPNTTYLEQLTASENSAKQQGIGIWSVE